jgi:hypothetical protein
MEDAFSEYHAGSRRYCSFFLTSLGLCALIREAGPYMDSGHDNPVDNGQDIAENHSLTFAVEDA